MAVKVRLDREEVGRAVIGALGACIVPLFALDPPIDVDEYERKHSSDYKPRELAERINDSNAKDREWFMKRIDRLCESLEQ